MIPSSLELNSDDFPFFGDLERTSGSGEKLEKRSFENRDNHHRLKPREMMIRKNKKDKNTSGVLDHHHNIIIIKILSSS